MAKKYPEFEKLNQPEFEKNILNQWIKNKTFEKSISLRSDAKPFVFYEGPPSANGMPGIHHVISRTIKDMFCRYKTQQNFQVNRKAGWDTHGLPIELNVEKNLGITKEDIGKKISVEDYNARCKSDVLKYKEQWELLTHKMGYWVDIHHPYITYEAPYIESVWWCLKELHRKNFLYKSVSIQPYSPAAGTGLSSHELNQPGTYKNVKDTSIIAMFELAKKEKQKNTVAFEKIQKQLSFNVGETEQGPYFLAWTTTPWTLPSNLGLSVGKNIEYNLIKTFNQYTGVLIYVILANKLLNKYFNTENENGEFDTFKLGNKNIPWKNIATFKGEEFENLYYNQLLPYTLPETGDPFKVIIGDFVTTEDGTGIVHTAPAFGTDDYKVGQKNNLGILVLVDREGKFIDSVKEFAGRYVKNYKNEKDYVDVNVDISVKLKKENRAFKVEKYEHNYPHCWRTDKPILYYPLDAWFIKTTAVKNKMIEWNNKINWKPASTGTGRFGNWLENMVDWNLSRSRYWGTPLPIWKTKDGKEEKCIGSIHELKKEIENAKELNTSDILNNSFNDLHKPFVDNIILKSNNGQAMYREPDLIDVWFDSGAMPYAQWHYPFENTDVFKNNFPADYVCEGVDQTRGWFFTLHAIAVMLFDSYAFKNVVSNGLVLDKDGNKMSKRLGNVINPFEVLEKYGADAIRWYLVTNSSPWDNLKFDIEGIKEVQRKFFGTLYNTYQFFILYANVDGFKFSEKNIPIKQRPKIDQWILSCLNSLIKEVEISLDKYEAIGAYRAVDFFLDEQLSNWFVRLCRRRFWKGSYEEDKISAYQTLYECLETISKLIAPITPFFAEWLFNNLNNITQRHKEESVHHTLFPKYEQTHINEDLEKQMELAQNLVSMILSLRKNSNIKVRQPLTKILIPVLNKNIIQEIKSNEALILNEVNIKSIEYISDTDKILHKKLKPNFAVLGKKLGNKVKILSQELATVTQAQIQILEKNNSLKLTLENEEFEFTLNEFEILSEDMPGWTVATKGTLTVALDLTITEDLINEGNAREFVNRIQKIRKDEKFELTDRIIIRINQNVEIKKSLEQFKNYICEELLCDEIIFDNTADKNFEIDVNELIFKIQVERK